MKADTENIKNYANDDLFNDLSEMVMQKKWELLNATNYKKIVLFRRIGVDYNQCINQYRTKQIGKLLPENVSLCLVSSYGPYFQEKSLKKMGNFVDKFTDITIFADISAISWNHILLLLNVKNQDALLFYIKLTIEKGLNVKSLRKEISTKTFERHMSSTHNFNKNFSSGEKSKNFVPIWAIAQNLRNYSIIDNFFDDSLLPIFRCLTEPNVLGVSDKLEKNLSKVEKQLFDTISQRIKEFQSWYNRRLNADLNKFFWEVGSKIKEITKSNSEDGELKINIKNLATKLEKAYGKTFNERGLNQMLRCAEQFPELAIFTRVAYLVSWEHIMFLLPLQGLEAKLFYARLSADQGMDPDDLQKEVIKNTYEETSGAKEQEQQALDLMRNPIIKKSIKREGNNTFKGTTRSINFGDDMENSYAVTNIFKNSYFLEFITAYNIPEKITVA